MTEQTLETALAEFVGQEAEPPRVARYAVNKAMIRNWVEAHDDHNPVYVDAEAARASGRPDVVCPPAMISTWVMAGYRRHRAVQRARVEGSTEDSPYARLLRVLDEAGYTSVVATNVEQDYHREPRPGDRVTARIVIEAVSGVKRTALGAGVFLTLRKAYRNQVGELLTEERFRLLRFDPRTAQERS